MTTSTTHAEFVAMTKLAKDVIWCRGFLREIGLDMGEPTTVLCDNMAAVALAFNPTHHERTKHFAVLQQGQHSAALPAVAVLFPRVWATTGLGALCPNFEHCARKLISREGLNIILLGELIHN